MRLATAQVKGIFPALGEVAGVKGNEAVFATDGPHQTGVEAKKIKSRPKMGPVCLLTEGAIAAHLQKNDAVRDGGEQTETVHDDLGTAVTDPIHFDNIDPMKATLSVKAAFLFFTNPRSAAFDFAQNTSGFLPKY